MTSLTGRLLRIADSMQELRSDLNNLAILLLDDDNGISTDAYHALVSVFSSVGGMPELNADATDGRWYIPNRSM